MQKRDQERLFPGGWKKLRGIDNVLPGAHSG